MFSFLRKKTSKTKESLSLEQQPLTTAHEKLSAVTPNENMKKDISTKEIKTNTVKKIPVIPILTEAVECPTMKPGVEPSIVTQCGTPTTEPTVMAGSYTTDSFSVDSASLSSKTFSGTRDTSPFPVVTSSVRPEVVNDYEMASSSVADVPVSIEPIQPMDDRISQLESELLDKNHRLEQLEATIRADGDKQAQLETLERFEAEWIKDRELIDNEREEELRLLQEALEEALEEKAEIESKMLRDASRESQLLDDFEWKLGEIERDYKKKVAEAEKAAEERVKKEMAAEYQQMIDDKQDIDKKLTEIAHLKSYEAEVTQLRGLIHEQQRAIRVAARQIDQLRVNERLLQDDLKKLSTQGCTRKQAQEMEEKWEEKTMTECNRLRAELLASNEEEMLKAIRQVVREKDEQIANLKRQFENQQLALNQQINELVKASQERETKTAQQLETARTIADRDLWDLRRQLSKAQDMHVEQVEQLERKHAEAIERCTLINEKTLEDKIQGVELEHQTQLNALQNLIEEEKQEALTTLGNHYRSQLESLQDHIAEQKKKWSELKQSREEEIKSLSKTIAQQKEQIELLQQHPDKRSENLPKMSNESSSSEDETDDEEVEDESSLPNGRSAGDGCSPSTSATASQDNLNPIATKMCDPAPQLDHPVQKRFSANSSSSSDSIQRQQHVESSSYCEDPEHLEAQQIILEMHQVLADRDAELQRLTEEKRFYQLELIHWERNLALQRAGLPLALIPDEYSLVDECDRINPWRGYSAPPVTKPRLSELQQQYQHLSSATAALGSGSRPASYGILSPSILSFSPDGPSSQLLIDSNGFQVGGDLGPYSPAALFGLNQSTGMHQQQPPTGSHYYYSDDEDEDRNNNGFFTPL